MSLHNVSFPNNAMVDYSFAGGDRTTDSGILLSNVFKILLLICSRIDIVRISGCQYLCPMGPFAKLGRHDIRLYKGFF